ncbi:GNAT family N-acetyltransferase [Agromyces sp. SYSU K20354]|uniref:GNAT family N-acetyltransferase n=1 Tax=Agromyces cavernae TaxID=2898659 RepID=UPI001E62A5A6|nr:GNAT family N-acetyltransferase [Agromyces cavernae]MCD2442984.1 GNAT family N-acetyltransferase [Agromyces cavernae]
MSAPALPLAARLGTVPPVALPLHPDVVTWRPAVIGDTDELLAFAAAVARADHPNWVETRDDVVEVFELSYIEPERDTLVGVGADGRILASGSVVCPPGQETLVRSIVLGAVRPDVRGRGIGRALLDWELARARQQLAASEKLLPGWIMAYAEQRAPDAQALLERAGLSLQRHFFTLERELEAPVGHAPVPAGVEFVHWAAAWSESTRRARNAAFADHWGSQSRGVEAWARFVDGEQFAPELSFLAIADAGAGPGAGPGAEVVGFVLALRNESDWAGQGFTSSYVQLVGVVREWRGRRIAQALLAEHLEACRRAGLEKATLDVDAENPTGALGLYTAHGFEVAHTHLGYVREY